MGEKYGKSFAKNHSSPNENENFNITFHVLFIVCEILLNVSSSAGVRTIVGEASFSRTSKSMRIKNSLCKVLYLFTLLLCGLSSMKTASPPPYPRPLRKEVNFIICGFRAEANAFSANIPHRLGKSIFRHASLQGAKVHHCAVQFIFEQQN
jgi:hypothetical protein